MKTVVISGGTGTFGQAMTRFLLKAYPEITIRILSRGEWLQQQMARTLPDPRVRFLLGDVRDLDRLRMAFAGADLVLHAAALKQVDKGEYDGIEFIKTNIIGTQHVVTACQDAGVTQAIFLSSDKACHPVNLYGATKAVAERLWIQANHYQPCGTRLAAVRYGNVMGSRGGVLETWRQMLSEGKPLPLTDPQMTRFWMTIAEAVRLVDWVAQHGLRGGIVVPHLPAFRLDELAYALQADEQRLPFHVIGCRPGEKLAEELMTPEELARAWVCGPSTQCPVSYCIPPVVHEWGASDPQVLWREVPAETLAAPLSMGSTGTYASDTWRWRLRVPDLRQRLQEV